jgi:hypothetical protein
MTQSWYKEQSEVALRKRDGRQLQLILTVGWILHLAVVGIPNAVGRSPGSTTSSIQRGGFRETRSIEGSQNASMASMRIGECHILG